MSLDNKHISFIIKICSLYLLHTYCHDRQSIYSQSYGFFVRKKKNSLINLFIHIFWSYSFKFKYYASNTINKYIQLKRVLIKPDFTKTRKISFLIIHYWNSRRISIVRCHICK